MKNETATKKRIQCDASLSGVEMTLIERAGGRAGAVVATHPLYFRVSWSLITTFASAGMRPLPPCDPMTTCQLDQVRIHLRMAAAEKELVTRFKALIVGRELLCGWHGPATPTLGACLRCHEHFSRDVGRSCPYATGY